MSGFFNAPFDPPEPTRMGDTVKNIACKFWKKNNVKIWTYRKIYLKVLENFLEEYLTETFKCSVNLKLYNLLDYYHVFGGNFMNAYISQIIKLFPGAQYKFNRKDLKTSLFYLCLGICRKNAALIARIIAYEGRRTKQWSVIIAFLFRIIAEVFYYVPGPGETILSKDFQRASCMRVKISGKKEGEMRALKQNYYFSNLQGKMVPTQTLSVDVDYSLAESRTVAGILGVKVWIY